jgi:hypothetical protein
LGDNINIVTTTNGNNRSFEDNRLNTRRELTEKEIPVMVENK